MICGQCGDELTKVPSVKITQVIGFFVASVFLAPLLMMVLFLVDDINNLRINNSSEELTFFPIILDDEKNEHISMALKILKKTNRDYVAKI